jgi:hypothetical protein
MPAKLNHRMEMLFGLFGTILSATCVITAAFLTPGYDPRIHTISSLGYGQAKSLFSIGLVIGGAMNIPFFIYLERELVNIKENIRRLATGVSIFTAACISLSGIIPDETYHDLFIAFHGFVASVAFTGSCIYITLYSILMYQGPKTRLYTGPNFKKFLAYFGLCVNIPLVVYFITGSPLAEWILYILIMIWVLATIIFVWEFKFFNIAGVYYRKSHYPEALNRFKDAHGILTELDLEDHPIAKTLLENIDYLKGKVKDNT